MVPNVAAPTAEHRAHTTQVADDGAEIMPLAN